MAKKSIELTKSELEEILKMDEKKSISYYLGSLVGFLLGLGTIAAIVLGVLVFIKWALSYLLW